MNKTIARWLWILGGLLALTICLLFGQLSQEAELNNSIRRNPTDVILPDWQGKWNCNLDGRQTQLDFQLGGSTLCQGNICEYVYKLAGRMSGLSEGDTPLEPRDYGRGDPPTARLDHLLPLSFKTRDGWLPMLLMMHTGNRDYSSGYVTWNGIPYGIQCHKS